MCAARFLADPDQGTAPAVAGSFRVGTQMMQDAVSASGVSVGAGLYNQEALFANPFKDGREEALVINLDNQLTYLERTDASGTGWIQALVQVTGGTTFAEVVVAVHPDQSVWAFCVPSGGKAAVQAFLLTKTGEKADGTALCGWVVPSGPISERVLPVMSVLSVSYTAGAAPVVLGQASGPGLSCIAVSPMAPTPAQPTFNWTWIQGPALNESGRIVGGGYVPNVHQPQAVEGSYIYYVLTGNTLTRHNFYSSYTAGQAYGSAQVSTSVASFCGTWNVPDFPQSHPQCDTGYIYLDSDGNLVTGYWVQYADHGQQRELRTGGLGLLTGSSWQDANGFVHVFGLGSDDSDSGYSLRVLHQSGWQATVSPPDYFPVFPAWTSAAVAGGPLGIGGFNLTETSDRLVAFDFTRSGKSDHLLGYGPGTSPNSQAVVYVLGHRPDGTFEQVYQSDTGLPGYLFNPVTDKVVPIDYTGSGSEDHLLVCDIGGGRYSIYKGVTQGGVTVLAPVTTGTGGLVPKPPFGGMDQIAVFDYKGLGNNDHLLIYRPGAGAAWVLAPSGSQSSPYTIVAATANGIGGYNLNNAADRVTGLDYNSTGSSTHLLAYRPGGGMAFIVHPDGSGGFTAVVSNSTGGIGGYDLAEPEDRLVPFDYTGLGYNDRILAYRPGDNPRHGDQTAWVLERVAGDNAYHSLTPPSSRYGLGGYDFASSANLVTGLDYNGTGGLSYLVAFRPGAGKVSVMGQRGENFIAPVYQAPPAPAKPVVMGLHADVISFQLDPHPDYRPSELIKMSGAAPAEAYCVCTQDVTTSGWVTNKVRLPEPAPAAGEKLPDPHIVSHYVADVTLLDTRGAAMPGHDVSVSADSLVETQINAVSYQVGPGRPIVVRTDARGRFTLSIAARGLNPPVIHLNSDGLESGTAINFGAQANDFLSGTGSLPSQGGAFTPDLLENAQAIPNTTPKTSGPVNNDLADWTALKERGLTPQAVVDHCTHMYGQAAGSSKPLLASIEGFDEPQPIIGYVIQLWDPDRSLPGVPQPGRARRVQGLPQHPPRIRRLVG